MGKECNKKRNGNIGKIRKKADVGQEMDEPGGRWALCAPVGPTGGVETVFTRPDLCRGSNAPCNQEGHGPGGRGPGPVEAGIGGVARNQGEVLIESESRKKKGRLNRERRERGEKREEIERRLRMVFWNVAGIGNKDEDFWNYIRKFDIVNLSETRTETKNWKRIEKWLPKEYRWEVQWAIKDKKKGRRAGEMLTGIRKTLIVKSIEKERRDMMNMVVEIEEENWRIISVYNRTGKKEYLKNLEEEMERGGWSKIIIGGDFNARTAEQGCITWNENEEEKEEENSQKTKH